MKLLNCLKCHDILSLTDRGVRVCRCGSSSGKYLEDGILAEYSGPARILGISNKVYVKSLSTETKLDAMGMSTPRWEWFVILEGQNVKKTA